MANNITKSLLIYISISLMFYSAGFQIIDNENFIDSFITVEQNNNVTKVNPSGTLTSTLPTSFQESGINIPGLNLIDGLRTIINFLSFLINISLAPFAVFGSFNFNPIIVALVGVPLLVMYILGIISLIRSGT
jgi:hypothetical protein